MRRLKYFTALTMLLLMNACSDELREKEKPRYQRTTFKNLVVNHRFETPLGYIAENHDDISGLAKGGLSLRDFSMDDVAEVAEKSFKNYPYCSEENNFETDFKMIKADFPNLNEKEILKNEATIERYYNINLEYEVLQKLKKTKKPRTKKEKTIESRVRLDDDPVLGVGRGGSSKPPIPPHDPNCKTKMGGYSSDSASKKICIGIRLFIYSLSKGSLIYSNVMGAYSLVKSRKEANRWFGNSHDTKTDAKRHIYWSALLARNYYTISSKHPRLHFAKAAGDANEKCGDNNTDAAEMDYHNNAIGRKVFDSKTSYRKFLWMTLGLNVPSEYTLRREAERIVNNASEYIEVKKALKSEQDTICFRKNMIKYTSRKKAVYLEE